MAEALESGMSHELDQLEVSRLWQMSGVHKKECEEGHATRFAVLNTAVSPLRSRPSVQKECTLAGRISSDDQRYVESRNVPSS